MVELNSMERATGIFTRSSRDAAGFDAWIAARLSGFVAPFYSSADIRDSGVKAACVDMNLFPADRATLVRFADTP